MTTFLIAMAVLAVISTAVISVAIYAGSKSDENTDRIMLAEWQSKLERNDLVRVDGRVWRIERIEGKVAMVSNYSEQIFVLLKDCYPID